MEVRRRTLLGWCALAAVPLLPLLDRILPKRVTRAIRTHAYPGPVEPLDEQAVRRPGRWQG